MTILDRYVLRKFAAPFIYCFFGFTGVWFIFDLSEHLPDFITGRATPAQLAEYYGSQLPEIVVVSIPLATLLALLYSLTAMSRSNEIISMLGAGRSVFRIILPLLAVGILLGGVVAFFNYEGAPQASGVKKEIVSNIKRGEKRTKMLKGHLFRNREDFRTWFAGRMPAGGGTLEDVQIVQQDASGGITAQWHAWRAEFDPYQSRWVLSGARHAEYGEEGEIRNVELKDTIAIDGWSETPWRIASSMMKPDFLSVPQLRDYLKFNSDFPENRLAPYLTHLHYRWAVPAACFFVVLVAAPCGIVYSRRGVLGGVALAIALFFLLVLSTNLFLALGKGGRVPPVVAAWGPMAVFFLAGLYLLWLRSTNRDLPKPRIPGLT
jgi:lipopolysaccharide export system permease protein